MLTAVGLFTSIGCTNVGAENGRGRPDQRKGDVSLSPASGHKNVTAATSTTPSEVYLAFRTDGQAGKGTATDPLDVSTAAKFDAAFAAIKPASAVHLGPGTFHTRGTAVFTIKANTKIHGSGMEVTKIIQDNSGQSHATVFEGNDGGYEIDDLSIDCGYQNQRKVNGVIKSNAAAIHLMGSNCAVRRCMVSNYGSTYDDETGENFAVGLFGSMDTDATNLIIEDCVFTGQSLLQPTGCSVATISGGPSKSDINLPHWSRGAVMRRNHFLGHHFGCHGITMSGCQGCIVEENYFEHFMGCGIYTDTWPLRDHIYQNNIFCDVNQAIFLAADTWDLSNFQIRGNIIQLHDGYDVVKIEKGVVTTDIPYSLTPGKQIGFRGMKITGGSIKNDQVVYVISTPTRTTFTYSTVKDGKSDVADTASGGFSYGVQYGCTTPTPEGINLFSGGNAKEVHSLKNFVISGNVVRPYSSDGKNRIPSTGIRICGAEGSQIINNMVFDSGNHRGIVVGSTPQVQSSVICRDNHNIDNTQAVPVDDQGKPYTAPNATGKPAKP